MNRLEELKQELANGTAQLLDVREPAEWESGHLSAATLVPLSKLQNGNGTLSLNTGIKTYLHCRSGQRVLAAKPILEQLGFVDVIALPDGFVDLAQNGFVVAES